MIYIGPRANKHRLSCVCLHSDRSADERQNNLQRFKNNEVRFLICTDVAARGIDVSGLPFGEIKEIFKLDKKFSV
jgi:ATP-dependent RNA helicase DDX1